MSECTKCGHCCRTMIIEVYWFDLIREPGLQGHVTMFPEDDISDRDGIINFNKGQGCPFLKENLCSIYPTRPTVCVAFEAGIDKQCSQLKGKILVESDL